MTLPQLIDACGWTLLHSVWQIAAVAVLLGVVLRAMSTERCNVRYICACVALLFVIAAIAGTFAWEMQSALIIARQEDSDRETTRAPLPHVPVRAVIVTDKTENAPPVHSPSTVIGESQAAPTESLSWHTTIETWLAPWIAPIVALWTFGVCLLSLRLGANWLAVRQLRASGCAIEEPIWTRALARIQKRLAVSRPVALLQSSAAAVPMVIGWLKPVVLVPMELVSGLTSAEIEAILAHELAHILRHDYLVNLLQNIVETLLFYHPGMWWVSRQIRREREFCCDDIAAQLCEGTAAYARALATVETMRSLPPALSVAATGGSLLDRIRRLAGREPRQAVGASGAMTVVLVLVLSCAIVLLASAVGTSAEAADSPKLSDEEATAIAQKAHQMAAKIHKLPKFYYRAKYRNGDVTTMKEIDEVSIENLRKAIEGTVKDEKWFGHEQTVAWDLERFLYSYVSSRVGEDGTRGEGRSDQFGSRSEGWAREQWDSSKPPLFIRRASIGDFWRTASPIGFDYFAVTPREAWWGDNYDHNHGHDLVPSEIVTYRHVGMERLGGEMCDVVEAPGRSERLWISRNSGLIRGSMEYLYQGRIQELHELPTVRRVVEHIAGKTFSSQKEYQQWHAENYEGLSHKRRAEIAKAWNEAYFNLEAADHFRRPSNLVIYSDYREIAPGVMWPFREDRAVWHHNDEKFEYIKCETVVEQVAVAVDLEERLKKLAPKKGDKVQDQRFEAVIEYDYDDSMTDEELQFLVTAKQAELKEGTELLKKLAEPMEKMVGQPAPELPAEGWIGERPELTGKPYLIHFWATWCGPCKNDLPILKNVAKTHQVIGIHPPGTDVEEIAKFVADEKLGYPTFVAQISDKDLVAGYPVKMYPYCVVVGANGRVAAQGRLEPGLMEKLREAEQAEDVSQTTEKGEQGITLPSDAETISVSGRVVDTTGKPVADALVTYPYFVDYEKRSEVTATDANGSFTLQIPSFEERSISVHLWAYCNGYGIRAVNLAKVLHDAHDLKGIELRLPPEEKPTYRVLLPDGSPCVGATVCPFMIQVPNGVFAADEPTGLGHWLPDDIAKLISQKSDGNGEIAISAIPKVLADSMAVTTPEFGEQHFGATEEELQLRDVGSIEGEVLADNVKALAGTKIFVTTGDGGYQREGTATTELDTAGKFVIPTIATGTVRVRVMWPDDRNDLPFQDSYSLKVRKGEFLALRIETKPTVELSGQILTEDTRLPVRDAEIFIRNLDSPDFSQHVNTDKDGAFKAKAYAGKIHFQVVSFGDNENIHRNYNYPRIENLEVPEDVTKHSFGDILLPPVKRLTGKLMDVEGQPLKNAKIGIHTGSFRHMAGNAVTEADGTFEIRIHDWEIHNERGLKWVMIAEPESPTKNPVMTQLRVVSDDPLVLQVREKREASASPPAGFRHMTIRTVDDAGKPVPNTRIYISIWPDEDNKYKKSQKNYFTDQDGNVEVLVPDPPRLFRVWTQKEGYVPMFANWHSGEQPDGDQVPDEFTFKLPTGTKIGGTVVDDSGRPIEGARLRVRLSSPVDEMGQRPVPSIWLSDEIDSPNSTCITDVQGRWSINSVPEGDQIRVLVLLKHPNYVSDPQWGTLQVEQSVTMESLRDGTAKIIMHDGPRAEGTVTANGKPVAGALVIWGDDPYLETGDHEVRTDAEGNYELPPLTPGVYPFTVVAKGWRPELSIVEIKPDMEANDFELKKGNVLRIKFVDEEGNPIPEVYVGIREWRGKKSLYNHHHPNVLNTKIPLQANKDGVYEWTWAPPDAVTYSIGKKGFRDTECSLIAEGDDEFVVELKRE